MTPEDATTRIADGMGALARSLGGGRGGWSAGPIVRTPIVCPFCQHTAPLTAYDLAEGAIYTCSGCQCVLSAQLWRDGPHRGGHFRWLVPLAQDHTP